MAWLRVLLNEEQQRIVPYCLVTYRSSPWCRD
jgi:hypothetical protein